jgi:hypothetical protein
LVLGTRKMLHTKFIRWKIKIERAELNVIYDVHVIVSLL